MEWKKWATQCPVLSQLSTQGHWIQRWHGNVSSCCCELKTPAEVLHLENNVSRESSSSRKVFPRRCRNKEKRMLTGKVSLSVWAVGGQNDGTSSSLSPPSVGLGLYLRWLAWLPERTRKNSNIPCGTISGKWSFVVIIRKRTNGERRFWWPKITKPAVACCFPFLALQFSSIFYCQHSLASWAWRTDPQAVEGR